MPVPHVSQWFAPVIGAIKKWFQADSYKADSVSPSLILDFANNRYAANSLAKNFSDILTFSRASTATYFDANGVMQTAAADVPRFDHDPATGVAKGLLVEGARTNLVTYSVPTSGQWGSGFCTAVFNTVETKSPSNSSDVGKFTAQATANIHYINAPYISFTNGTTYTFSAFVKAGTENKIQLTGVSAAFGTSQYANFLLTGDGSVTASVGGNASIKKCANGWYRVSFTVACTATISVSGMIFGFIDSTTALRIPTFTPAGTETFYIWGGQCEAGSFPSSLIPTSGSAVTRAADVAMNTSSNTVPFSDWYNQSEGGFFVGFTPMGVPPASQFSTVVSATDGTDGERISISHRHTLGIVRTDIIDGGVAQASVGTSTVTTQTYTQFASSYKLNDCASSLNGGAVATDTSVTIPTPNSINFNGAAGTSDNFLWVKELRYYPIRVTNSEMVRLTT